MTQIKQRLGLAAAALTGALTLALSAGSANAAITLENPGLTTYQQQENSPCVIGDPSCQNPGGFGFGLIPGGPGSYDVSSPDYTVGQIETLLGTSTFTVGIDVNTTTHPLATEVLNFFGMYVNGVLVQSFGDLNPLTPGEQLFTNNNGNGFSDELLHGFDLSAFADGATVSFRTLVGNATDGREEFFLISTNATPVPEPASLALLGAGLLGLGLLRRRFNRV